MADWTAITGIIVSGVLGPGVGGQIAARRANREHAHSRILADRAELRAALDEAAQVLQQGGRLRRPLLPAFITHGATIRAHASEQIEQFHDPVRQADLHDVRLSLRLGSHHEVVEAHHAALRALVKASDAIGMATDLGSDANLGECWEMLEESGPEFDAAFTRFMAAAHTLAASELERSSRRRAEPVTDV